MAVRRNKLLLSHSVLLAALSAPVAANSHDIYEELTKNSQCSCSDSERLCEPVEAIRINEHYYLPATGETFPARLAEPSPDERFHRCTDRYNRAWHPRYGVPAYPGANFTPNGRMLGTEGPEGWVTVPNNRTKDGKPPTRCFFAPRAIM